MYQEMMNSIAGVVEVDERTTRKSFSFKKAASWGCSFGHGITR